EVFVEGTEPITGCSDGEFGHRSGYDPDWEGELGAGDSLRRDLPAEHDWGRREFRDEREIRRPASRRRDPSFWEQLWSW
ncbi:hypothetical protein RZS08_02170, partial [Arthrospira platensis SPKY1]|nr:hypothetical protein [Arthrospira platensis SPKY1]